MIDSSEPRSEVSRPAPTLTQALGGRCAALTDCVGVGALVAGACVQPAPATFALTWQEMTINGVMGFLCGAALPVLAYMCAVRIRSWWRSLLPVVMVAGSLGFMCWQAFHAAWGFPEFADLLCGSLVAVVPLIGWGMARSRAWGSRHAGGHTEKP